MKHYSLIMALILGTMGSVFAQQTTPQEVFTICLGSFVEVDQQDFVEAKQFGYLYSETYSQHLTQVFLGEYAAKSQAEDILSRIKTSGFPDAFLSQRKLSAEDEVQVIQLGIEILSEKIHWQTYAAAKPLSVLLDGEQVRVVTGPYRSQKATENKMKQLKELGFANIFVRTVNSLRLHPVTDFEAPELFLPDPEPIMAKAQPSSVPTTSELPKPDFSEALTEEVVAGGIAVPPVQEIPDNYQPEFTARSGEQSKLAMPTIRMDIQRTSALKLQTALKLSNWYEGSVDGKYGPETEKALAEFLLKDDQWKRFELIKRYLPVKVVANRSGLPYAIANVVADPEVAKTSLIKLDHPMAKAYRAYMLHTNRGEIEEVNKLMNAANKTAFTPENMAYDISVDYAYNNINQLLTHLAQMHAANLDIAVPCWLFQRHPEKATAAFAKVDNYTMESCDLFMDWEVLSSLKTIAMELDANAAVNVEQELEEASLRAKLFVNPVALTNGQQKQMLNWNELFWKKFENWVAKDALHKKNATSLKVAFFQSQVLLEDYFLNRGFNYKESKVLALSVIKSVVHRHFSA